MSAAVLQALTRHLITAVGGALAARYGIDGQAIDAIAGGVAVAVATAWSVYDKKRRGE